MGTPKYIVVVGASAGGLHSITELSARLTDKTDAAVCIVLHFGHIQKPKTTGAMPDMYIHRTN